MYKRQHTKTDGCYKQSDTSSNKESKGNVQSKNIVREMKSFFDGHISRLSTVEERISKLEDMPIETFYIEFVKRKN